MSDFEKLQVYGEKSLGWLWNQYPRLSRERHVCRWASNQSRQMGCPMSRYGEQARSCALEAHHVLLPNLLAYQDSRHIVGHLLGNNARKDIPARRENPQPLGGCSAIHQCMGIGVPGP